MDIEKIINIATLAGEKILDIYKKDTANVKIKNDGSPVTTADLAANKIICDILTALTPDIPILSEESIDQINRSERQKWSKFWLIDPLDGTKEFINKTDEFTVNIALIDQGEPVLGVVYAPALKKTYFAKKGHGAFLRDKAHSARRLLARESSDSQKNTYNVVTSRSHNCEKTNLYIKSLETQGFEIARVPMGSSLKFCIVAENKAECYPRFGPTMEWDTGAGDIIAREAGKQVLVFDEGTPLEYNKDSLLNPAFIVS